MHIPATLATGAPGAAGIELFAAIGVTEWVIIAVVVVLLFGARKLPELARSMGSSITEFKKGLKDSSAEGRLGEGRGEEAEGSAKASERKEESPARPL